MKAGIFFTGTGPIVILTSYESFTDPGFVAKLEDKGILKFVVFELTLEKVRQKYGATLEKILNDLKQSDDCRVLDFNGHNIFQRFSLKELGPATFFEP